MIVIEHAPVLLGDGLMAIDALASRELDLPIWLDHREKKEAEADFEERKRAKA